MQLAQTATDNEKIAIAKITQQFLLQHDFFKNVCKNFDLKTREKVLNIIVKREGAIPHKNIISLNSFDSIPERVFFEKKGVLQWLKTKDCFEWRIWKF